MSDREPLSVETQAAASLAYKDERILTPDRGILYICHR